MYDPITPAMALYVALGATAVSAASAAYQGQQAKKEADYNAAIMEQNAIAAKNKAAYDETMHRERVRKLLSTQKAQLGRSGISLEGSPLLILEETVAQGELDALAIRYGGDIEASRSRSAANLSRMQGKSAITSGYVQAGSTLLSGGSRAYSNYSAAIKDRK